MRSYREPRAFVERGHKAHDRINPFRVKTGGD